MSGPQRHISQPPRSHIEEELGHVVEEVTGSHSLVRMTAEAVGQSIAQGMRETAEVIAQTIREVSVQNKRPWFLDAVFVIALAGALSTAAVAMFKADVAYSDHDTVIRLQTLIPEMDRFIQSVEQFRRQNKASDQGAAK